MPRRHPTTTPTVAPAARTHLITGILSCSFAKRGSFTPNLPACCSIVSARPRPKTSEIRFPRPAAASVVIPSATPSDDSISLPAVSMMALSTNPKPTKGMPLARPTVASWAFVGLAALLQSRPSATCLRFLSRSCRSTAQYVSNSSRDSLPSMSVSASKKASAQSFRPSTLFWLRRAKRRAPRSAAVRHSASCCAVAAGSLLSRSTSTTEASLTDLDRLKRDAGTRGAPLFPSAQRPRRL
mmetsp:Transcript_6988/g.20972  ORF Transcript_6988/g.20972 Transcript_6988/m.20972 type:complete len:240 (-) Transcript_6988:340-1059(-)